MRRAFVSLLMLLGVLYAAHGQSSVTITGTVMEEEAGIPAIGASVQIKGTTTGVMTDADGNYKLNNVPANATLVFTYIGKKTEEVPVNGKRVVNASLKDDSELLEEVVVVAIGYGTTTKRDLTGSIVSVSGDDIKTIPDNNPMAALQGRVPGLTVTNSGSAGSSPTVRIRGVGSMNAQSNPLYVVDGMFVDNIDFINPKDVLSTEVLKDASSLAIFGVQGANGVIIITTNRAQEGRMNVTFDGYAGIQMLHQRDRLQLTNSDEFTMLYNEQIQNAYTDRKASGSGEAPPVPFVPTLKGEGTDWQSLVIRPAFITNNSISLSTSSDKGSSIFTLGYFKQDGIVKYNTHDRFNVRYANDYKVNKYITIGGNLAATRWETNPESAQVQVAARAFPTYNPNAPASNWDPNNLGSYYAAAPSEQTNVGNPVARMEIYKDSRNDYGYRGVGNVYTEIKFLNDFSFKATGYADLGVSYGSEFTPAFRVEYGNPGSTQQSLTTRLNRTTHEYTKYQADLLLNYNKTVNKHRIGAMVGYTVREQTDWGFNAQVDSLGFDSQRWNIPEDMRMLSTGDINTFTGGDSYNSESFISYISRFNYAYNNKYLLTGTFRVDGSSKFSSNHRWGYFPSVGTGWIISEEDFMGNLKDKIGFLKLKASWGQLGNDKIGNYLSFPSINPRGISMEVDGRQIWIPTVAYIVDSNIHWEVVTGTDIGVELRMFDSRLSADLGWYSRTTSDMLVAVPVAAALGNSYEVTNAGSMRNHGIEYMLSWRDKVGDFTYSVNTNGATVKNEVLSLANDNRPVSSTYHRTEVGHSVGSFFGLEQIGIYQNQEEINNSPSLAGAKPGDVKYKDRNGDGRITTADRTFLGTPMPTFTYGLNATLEYKGFDLLIDFSGVAGNKILNLKKIPGFAPFNYYDYSLNRWHGEGTSNTEPQLNTERSNNYMSSSYLLESGAYLRLRTLQLGYTLPKGMVERIGLSSMRVYINAQNLFTLKANSGYTPEIGGGVLDGGRDEGTTYPIPTIYSAGLTINF